MTPISQGRGDLVLLWRIPTLLASLAIIGWTSHTWTWAFALGLPLTLGMLALHLFPQETLERWVSKGYLLLTDTVLLCLALLGTGRVQSSLFIGLFTIILVATLLSDRRKTLLATGVLLALMAGLASGDLPGFDLTGDSLLYLPFLLCAALTFGSLAEQMSGQPQAVARARHENSELRALLQITESIGSSLDVAEVMRNIVKRVGDLVDSDSCSILLCSERLRRCFVVASKDHPEVDMLEVDLAKYPEVQQALETREPVVIEDVETNPLVASVRQILLEKGYRSLLVVPLVFGREVLGTLFLRARREQPFSREEIRFCKVAAGTSANALKNALLYREVAEEAEKHRATGQKLRRVLDGTPDLIVAADRSGSITEFNRGAEGLTGWQVEHALGHNLSEVLGAEVADVIERGETEDRAPVDAVLRRRDGERLEVSLVGAPLTGPEGEQVGRVWIGRDVTKLRRVERSLIQAERLSSLGEVVAGVAHELNNPLSGVMGYAELLRSHAHDSGQIRDLTRIVESAERCQKIVLNLLSFARQHPPEKKYHSLNDCVTKVLELKSYHLRSSQIETVLQLDPGLPSTCFDFHQIEQVILNLLNNAEHAMASLKTAGKIVLRTGSCDDTVYFEIEDDGPGVPASIRDRLFDPFFTTKDFGQGTGLGLSVSYGIVREHGGRIELRSTRPDGGACFTVVLPLIEGVEPTVEQERIPSEESTSPLRGMRVLVAEDEPVVLELFSRLLSEDGAEATLTHDGEEAWARLQHGDYDLIIADLRMPKVSGQQLYDRVAAERPELLRRIVFATGDLVRPETVAFLEGLPNRILPKPLEVVTVRRVLAQAVAGLEQRTPVGTAP